MLGKKRGELAKVLDVLGELLTQIGTLDFDDNTPSIAQHRGVHLPETRASQRLLLE